MGRDIRCIEYHEGDLFEAVASQMLADKGTVYVPHVVNTAGVWGAGFVVPLGKRWPEARLAYLDAAQQCQKEHEFGYQQGHKLGQTQIISVEKGKVQVCNMVAQREPGFRPFPLCYEALESCMEYVRDAVLSDMSDFPLIYAPLFGAGLAGGDWSMIARMIARIWCSEGIPVHVFYLLDRIPSGWTPPNQQEGKLDRNATDGEGQKSGSENRSEHGV